MSSHLKQEYLAIIRSRYRAAGKNERSQIIDELVANSKMHRKSAIRCLRREMRKKNPNWGRKKKYSVECLQLLRRIWRLTDYLCSRKIKEAMDDWLKFFTVNEHVRKEISKISPATIDRYLKPYRASEPRRLNSGTRPGCRTLKRIVPVKNLGNIASGAGYMEGDSVAHCGGSMHGEFIWSLTATDEFSGYTLNRAVWGHCAKNVYPAIEDIENNLPFEILSFNFDCGSEFLNQRLIEYFQPGGVRKRKKFIMTRSRSYHKNDNAHVEQKNWTTVRQLFGYDRFEFKELLPIMNEIYRIQNLLVNFFHPQFKLRAKWRDGAKIKKRYDKPKTPYRRLIEDPSITMETKNHMTELFKTLDPIVLRTRREALLADFFRLKQRLQSEKSNVIEPQNLALSG